MRGLELINNAVTDLLGLFVDLVLGSCPSLDFHEALCQHRRLLMLKHDHQIKDGAKPSQDWLQCRMEIGYFMLQCCQWKDA